MDSPFDGFFFSSRKKEGGRVESGEKTERD